MGQSKTDRKKTRARQNRANSGPNCPDEAARPSVRYSSPYLSSVEDFTLGGVIHVIFTFDRYVGSAPSCSRKDTILK